MLVIGQNQGNAKLYEKIDTLPPDSPNDQQTYYWLFWLASKLKQDDGTFLIERMQPSWLDHKQKCLYRISVGIIAGLVIGVIYGLTTGWVGAGIGGVTYGLIIGCDQVIYPIARLKFSIEYAKARFWSSVLEGLWWGLIYGLIDAIICGLIWGGEALIWGMVEVVIWGLVEGCIWGLWVPEFKKSTVSNQGIKESAKNAVTFTLIGGVAWLILYVLVLKATDVTDVSSLLLDAISCGLFFGIYIGGLACLQHFVLRLILWWNGYMPWNYAKFLDYASEQGFLEREGGRYRFKHSRD